MTHQARTIEIWVADRGGLYLFAVLPPPKSRINNSTKNKSGEVSQITETGVQSPDTTAVNMSQTGMEFNIISITPYYMKHMQFVKIIDIIDQSY